MDKHSAPNSPIHTLGATEGDFYDWLDLAIKTITLSLGLFAAFQALNAYQSDVKEKILDQRIAAFDDALTVAGQLVLAKDWDTFGQALDQFSVVRHGQVLAAIGRGDVYKAMVRFHGVGVDIWNKTTYADPIPEEQLETAFKQMATTFCELVVGCPADVSRVRVPFKK